MKIYNAYIINTRGNYVLDSFYATREIAESWVEFYKGIYRGKIEDSGVEEIDIVSVLPDKFVFETRFLKGMMIRRLNLQSI